MDGTELIGMLAAVLSTLAFLPQAIKTWRTGSADDFSLPTLLMFVTAIALWTVYGILRAATPVWLANGVTIVFASFILVVKLQNVRKALARTSEQRAEGFESAADRGAAERRLRVQPRC